MLLAPALLLLLSACGPEEGYPRPKVWPKPTEPPPASPIYHDVQETMPGEEEIARDAAERPARLEEAVATVLEVGDKLERETVFVYVLPELLQVEPQRVVDLHARLQPGEARATLRTEIAQLWASRDPVAATRWMKSLTEEERKAAAMVAVRTLVPWDPRTAVSLADELELELENDAGIRKLLRAGPARESAAN